MALLLGLALAGCGDDAPHGGLAQVDDATSTLDLGALTGHPTTPTTADPDTRDDTTTTAPDTRQDATTTTATDTVTEPDVTGPCATVDCDDNDPCTQDHCVGEGHCDHPPIECAPSDDPCQVATCDAIHGGCMLRPIDGRPPCDDGVACTDDDRCEQGQCVGTLKLCDDADPCTTDACIDGQCTATPVPSCAPDTQCEDQPVGAACDDGAASTTADLCLAGQCRGFAATRVEAAVVPDAVGLVLTDIDYGASAWTAVFWGLEGNGAQSWSLGKVSTASQASVYDGTFQRSAFTGLSNGWAVDDGGALWRLDGNHWSDGGAYDEVLSGDRGTLTDVWAARDTDANNNPGEWRVWVVGNDGRDEYIRYCRPGNLLFDDEDYVCDEQELDDFEASSLPQTVSGIADCGTLGCEGGLIALAADAAASGGHYTDTYENTPPGDDIFWSKGATPNAAANRVSRGIAGWGSTSEAQFLAVGSNGYLVHRRANGSWSAPLALRPEQARRTFTGVWAGAGVVIVSAQLVNALDNTKLEYELWTCPTNKDLEVGANWVVHSLAITQNVTAAGLYDVAGRPEGELRAVGAIRKTNPPPGTDLLDGVVYVRGQ